MRSRDSKEYYNVKEENTYKEFKPFQAEEYYSLENAKSPKELIEVDEIHNEETNTIGKKNEKDVDNSDQLRKLNNQTNQTNQATSTSSSSTSSASSSAHAVTEAAATTGSAVASVTVTAAAVVVSGVAGGLFPGEEPIEPEPEDPEISINYFYSKRLENAFETGSDYTVIKIRKSDMQMADDSPNDSYEIVISLDENTDKVVQIDNTNDEYLITGLKPETEYKYSVKYSGYESENNAFESYVTRYTSSFVSSKKQGHSTLLIDKANTHVELDEQNHYGTLQYSCFLSEYDDQYANPYLAITKDKDNEELEGSSIIAFDENWSDDHFFNGTISTLTKDTIYFNAFGVLNEEGDFVKLDEVEYKTQIPEDYSSYHPITIEEPFYHYDDAGSTTIRGVIRDINNSFNPSEIYCKSTQYDENDEVLGLVDASFEYDDMSMEYEFFTFVYYGVNKVKYTIYTTEGSILYETPLYIYEGDQSYDATFTPVSAKDAEIIDYETYDEATMTIAIDTGFDNHGVFNFAYRVEILDEEGSRLGSYEGDESYLTFVIPQDKEFSIRYTEVGTFVQSYHEYQTYYSGEKSIGKEPVFTLDWTPEFDGTHWVIPYICDSIYDYSEMYVELDISTDSSSYHLTVTDIQSSGVVVLDIDDPELGEIQTFGALYYKDFQNGDEMKSATIITRQYTLFWELNVTTTVDLTNNGATPVTFDIEYLCPDNWGLQIYDRQTITQIDLTNEYTMNLPDYEDLTLLFEFVNEDGNVLKPTLVEITPREAMNFANLSSFSFSKVNPGDSVVTYNDDGTMNLYRDMDVTGDTDHMFYDAMIYESAELNDDLNIMEYQGAIHNISNQRFSFIEDIAIEDYYGFVYYELYENNGIWYRVGKETPSGGIEHGESWYIDGSYMGDTDTSSIMLTMNSWSQMDNWYELDGIEYEFDSYIENSPNGYIISHSGNLEGSTLRVRCARYSSNYDDYTIGIYMKGDRYRIETYEIPTLQTV